MMPLAKPKAAGLLSTLALFGSFSTLFCCALPALFVTLGAGAALGAVVTSVPQLIWLSAHKIALFLFSGAMLSISGMLRWNSRNAPCPIDPIQARSCQRLRRVSLAVFGFSLAIYAIGFYFAFVARYFAT